jgi:ABC-2 type transport system permease protein
VSDLVAAEFLKLRTTRTFWWLIGSGILLGGLFTIGQLATSEIEDASEARSLLSNATTVFIFLVLLGVVGTAGEYRHGTITTTLLGAPDRLRIMVAKALAYALAGAVAGALSLLLVLAIALPWLGGDPSLSELGVDSGKMGEVVIGSIVVSALSAAFGVALGGLIPNQLGAIMAFVVVIFVLEPAVGALVDGFEPYSLGAITSSTAGIEEGDVGLDELFGAVPSGLLFLGYTASLLAAAVIATKNRDVG